MCGRYHLTRDPPETLRIDGTVIERGGRDPFRPRHNIAPSEPPHPPESTRKKPPRLTRAPIVRRHDDRIVVEDAVWPLVPLWANGEVSRYSTANARSESMRKSRTYARPWEHGQRCLVPATGFYEWQDVGERYKQPWSIEPLNDALFCFGGLWEVSYAPDDVAVLSFTIVTVAANPLMAEIHNAGKNKERMPLILPPEHRDAWLNGTLDDADSVVGQFPADEMTAREISTAINNPNVDDPKVLEGIA